MRFKATALTPVLVGDGRALAPIDYMVWKDQVNVLDQRRIFQLLARGPRLENYLTQLRRATKLDFASWGGFAQNFSQRRIPFEDPSSTTTWNAAAAESLFIPTFASDYRGAYLPASALKGALRSGLVFSRWSAGTLEKISASIEGERLPRRVTESAEASAGASQVRVMEIADSDPVNGSAFRVFLTRVASIDTRQPGKTQLAWKVAARGSVVAQRVNDATAVFAEMAVPGTSFSGAWEERTFLTDPELARSLGWQSPPNPAEIVAGANRYAAAQLEVHARYAELTGLEGLRRTLDRLKNELATAEASNMECLLCVGWGSGFTSKSGFLDMGEEPYRNLLRRLPIFAHSLREGAPFPKTRRIVFTGGQPSTMPGWIKLQFAG